MIAALSTLRNRTLTFILLLVGGLSVAVASVLGISDNPPGILLALAGATAVVLAFVHPWRTSRQFRRLLYASALCLILYVLLINVVEATASDSGDLVIGHDLLNGASIAFFFAVASGFLVSVVGAVAISLRNRGRPTHGPTAPD